MASLVVQASRLPGTAGSRDNPNPTRQRASEGNSPRDNVAKRKLSGKALAAGGPALLPPAASRVLKNAKMADFSTACCVARKHRRNI